MRTSPMMVMHSMGRDPDAAKAGVKKGTGRRVFAYTKPYRWMVLGFVSVIIVEAVLMLVPPLFFRRIIDVSIPGGPPREAALVHGLLVAVGRMAAFPHERG